MLRFCLLLVVRLERGLLATVGVGVQPVFERPRPIRNAVFEPSLHDRERTN
jgi:hypothetical protein